MFYGIHYPINYSHKQIETRNSRCIIFSPSVWLLTLTLFSLGNPFLSFLFLVLSKQFWRLSICTTHSPRSSWHLKHHSMSYEQLQKMIPTLKKFPVLCSYVKSGPYRFKSGSGTRIDPLFTSSEVRKQVAT